MVIHFSAAVDTIAAETQALLVRTQAAWDVALAHSTPDDWAADQIHLNQPGHTVIALELLRTIGFELSPVALHQKDSLLSAMPATDCPFGVLTVLRNTVQ